MPLWAHLFENSDAGVTRSAVEMRYPFMDLRVVNYLLAIPPFPWMFRKELLRKAMAQSLPPITIQRRKAPLAIQPVAEALKRPESRWLKNVKLCEKAAQYIDPSNFSPLPHVTNPELGEVMIRPLCLNFWLQSCGKIRYKFEVEVQNA